MRLIDANWIESAVVNNLNRLNIADVVTDTVTELIHSALTEGLPTTDKPEILEKAIDVWGKEAQVDVAIEEMSELIRALLKERRAEKYGRYASEQREAIHGKNGVIEETADVIIMLTQLCMIFGDSDEVQQAIEEKVDRLEKTLARADKGDSSATGKASQGGTKPTTQRGGAGWQA